MNPIFPKTVCSARFITKAPLIKSVAGGYGRSIAAAGGYGRLGGYGRTAGGYGSTRCFTQSVITRREEKHGQYPSPEFNPANSGECKLYSFEDVKKITEDPSSNIVLVDVREKAELRDTGKIPGAINIPVTTSPDAFFLPEEEFEDRYGFERPDKDAEVVFYCKAGVRSRTAAGLAREAGWNHTGDYSGSWLEWFDKGGKAERSP